MKLGEQLAAARKSVGITQPRAAEKIAWLDKSMLSKIEHGYCMPMLAQLEFLCMLYDYPQDKALELVAEEYGLKFPKKAEKVVDESRATLQRNFWRLCSAEASAICRNGLTGT